MKIYNQDIGKEFSIERRTILIMKSGKRHIREGVELSNQEIVERSEKRNLQRLWDIGSWHYQASGNERNFLLNISEDPENYSRQTL